jgi:hypothetical protein
MSHEAAMLSCGGRSGLMLSDIGYIRCLGGLVDVIDSNELERDPQIAQAYLRRLDCAEKPGSAFPHPAQGARSSLLPRFLFER